MRQEISALHFANIFLVLITLMTSSSTVAVSSNDSSIATLTVGDETKSRSDHRQLELDSQTVEAYEALNKWKGCARIDAPIRLVYKHNRSRAAASGFPTRLSTGLNLGLTEHETSAIFGWTTGDYRLINPIARGLDVVQFDDYPFLPNEMAAVKCRLNSEDVLPYIIVLKSALSKLPGLSSEQRLWRGHRRTISPSQVGSIFIMDGFISVTRDRENALEFAVKLNEGRSNRRTLVCILEHSSAKCISKLSARPGEMEVLFPPDVTFGVVDSPGETAADDLRAAQRAAEKMRAKVPEAEIDLVYVREVRRQESACNGKQSMNVLGKKDSTGSSIRTHIGEWE